MNHWPDIDRCKRLGEAGFRQDTLFIHAFSAKIDEWVSDYRFLFSEQDLDDGEIIMEWFAAPIVTELVEEIKKLVPGDVVYINIMEDRAYVCLSSATAWKIADAVPNALADLWLWLRGREK